MNWLGQGKTEHDRRIENEIEADVKKRTSVGAAGKSGQSPVDAIAQPIEYNQQPAQQIEVAGD